MGKGLSLKQKKKVRRFLKQLEKYGQHRKMDRPVKGQNSL
jgi:RAB protein geranylgeranyltransferase component A